jgi:hypothetical protein
MDFTLYSTSMTALGIRPGAFSVATAKFYCLSLKTTKHALRGVWAVCILSLPIHMMQILQVDNCNESNYCLFIICSAVLLQDRAAVYWNLTSFKRRCRW